MMGSYIFDLGECMTCWMIMDGHASVIPSYTHHSSKSKDNNLSYVIIWVLSVQPYWNLSVLFCTFLLITCPNSKSSLSLQETQPFHLQMFTLLCVAAFLCPLLHCLPSICLLSNISFFLPLSSDALYPCSILPHTGISYIMHVKQPDMSELLRCITVPLLLLHPPWVEVESFLKGPCVQHRLSWTKVFCIKHKLYIFYTWKINIAAIPGSIYTKSLRWKLFYHIKSY